MAYELLGESFDIHGGGIDLQFPHHENEIAQSACAHPEGAFARYWLHNEMLQVEGKKMSKSLGNFFTVRDLLDQGVPGEVIRFVMLSTHYRKPMDWTEKKRQEAEATLQKWAALTSGVAAGQVPKAVEEHLANDLNSPGVIMALHEAAALGDAAGLRAGLDLLGLGDLSGLEAIKGMIALQDEALVESLLSERVAARAAKDWARADRIRDTLVGAGVELRDGQEPAWVLKPEFDPAKLEALK
jgi:cysteinyl-tRNA synthetase